MSGHSRDSSADGQKVVLRSNMCHKVIYHIRNASMFLKGSKTESDIDAPTNTYAKRTLCTVIGHIL